MATLPGTNVAAKVVPFDSNDTFATHDEKYGLGGYRSVSNIAERDSITSLRIKQGMLVYVINEDKYYQLASTTPPVSSNWVQVFTAFSTGSDISRSEVAGISSNLQNQINNLSTPEMSGYTLLTTTAGISSYFENKTNNLIIDVSSISAVNVTQNIHLSNIASVSGNWVQRTDVYSISANLQTQINNINTNVNNVTGQFATLTLVSGTSGVLQTNINSKVSADILRTEVASISSGLQFQINNLNTSVNNVTGQFVTTINLDNFKTQVVGTTGNLQTQITNINTNVNGVTGQFATKTLVAGTSGVLQSNINSKVSADILRSEVSSISSGLQAQINTLNTSVNNVTGQFATITLVSGTSGVLQDAINSKVSADILRAEVVSVSSGLQTQINNVNTNVNNVTGQFATTTLVAGTSGVLQGNINTKIGDAPSDGNQYARKNSAWVIVTGVSGAGSSGAGFIPLAGIGMTITPSGNNYLFSVNDYISKTEVSNMSSGLQTQITNINTNVNGVTGQFATRTLVNGTSGVLQSNILNLTTSVNNVTGQFATRTLVAETSGVLQSNINAKISADILRTEVASVSSGLQNNLDNFKTQVVGTTGNLQEQITYRKYTGFVTNSAISGSVYPVVVGAVSGAMSTISKLDATPSAKYVSPLGFVTQNLSAGQYTTILWNGEVTFPSSTFVPGLPVYSSPSIIGGITQTKPVSAGNYIISLGTAKTDSILLANIEDPYLITSIDAPTQDRAVYFRSPSQLGDITVEIGDILVLNDASEVHPNLLTNSNYIVYRCVLQYIGDGNAINGSELLTNFIAIGNQPKYNQPVNFLDVTPSGMGQSGLTITKGELLVIDDSSVYSSVVPGSGNTNYFPTLVCTNPLTGSGTTITRSQIESNFRQLHDNKFKLSTTTTNNSSSVNLDFSSLSYEAYHITVKVMADGSTGYKYFATYQFGMTGEPIGGGGCTIQGALTEDILFNPLSELSVTFSDPGDTLQITFNSVGRAAETYTWKAWVIVERF